MEPGASLETIEAEVAGDKLRYVFDPTERLALLTGTIAAARETLQLYYYVFADGRAARTIIDGLIEARNRGVAVTLLVDGFGCQNQPDALFADLIEAGATFARFFPRFGRQYLIRNHQKMLIADRQIAIIGGCNIEDSYYFPDASGEWWQDMALRVAGPAAARLADYFGALCTWMTAERSTLRDLNAILRAHSDPPGPVRWLMSGPFPRLSPLTRAIKADVLRARSADMVHAYFTPNWGFLRRLGRLGRRGRLRLVTAARSDNETTIAAARYCYGWLLKRNARLYEYLPSRLHVKLSVIDDAVYAGSANFDVRSFYLNTEIMLRVEDNGLAERMRRAVAAHAEASEHITRPLHRARTNALVRLRRLFAYLLITALDFRLASALNRGSA